jgi:hypothetical protein
MVNKKGFLKTLMTVALALMSVSVFATAPMITDPGDFIIGENEQGAGNNVFVFPDAFNLDDSVTDDNTADASIKWSFEDPSLRYLLNGVVGAVVPDPNNPANDLRQLDNDTADAPNDADANTVTLRDEIVSPIAGGPYGDPGAGLVGSSVITLHASDSALYSSVNVVLYTISDASDSLSGGVLTNVFDYDYENDADKRTGWLGQVLPSAGAGTTSQTTGFCLTVPGPNIGGAVVIWYSPHNNTDTAAPGYIQLVDMAAWRLRATMYSDVTANNATPYWTFGTNNSFFTGPGGSLQSNIYACDIWVMDGTGGANAIGKMAGTPPALVGRYDYDFWAVPLPAKTMAWRGVLPDVGTGSHNDNTFSPLTNPAFDIRNDMNVNIRVLDDNAGINTTARLGTICLRRLRCDRVSLNDLTLAPINTSPINTATHVVVPEGLPGGSAGNGTGTIRNGTADVLFNLGPAYESGGAAGLNGGRKLVRWWDPAGVTTFERDFPLDDLWENDKVYLFQGAIRSDVPTNPTEGTDPVDLIFVDWTVPTNETGGFHYVQKGGINNMKRAGSPRLLNSTQGIPQEYVSIFAVSNETRLGAGQQPTYGFHHDALNANFDFFTSTGVGNATDGQDLFVLSTMELYEVDTTGF